MPKDLLTVCLFVLAQPCAAQDQTPNPIAVHVVAVSPEAQKARGGIHRAKHDESVILYAAVEAEVSGKKVVITSAPALILDGQVVPARRMVRPDAHQNIQLRWYKLEPAGNFYNNTAGGFHWDPIEYRRHPLGPWGQSWQMPADAHPVIYPDTHGGLGTMAFKLAVKIGDRLLSSPGKESIFRGGLSDAVIRVAFRRDDTFPGYLTELFNTPYIWGSAGYPPKKHQAERLIGSDCADFVVYGARRSGQNIPYRGSWHLPLVANTVARAEQVDSQGRFLQKGGKPVAIGEDGVHIGDLLLFFGHVGALLEDRKPVGILDTNDIMIHTFWAPPTEEPISKTAYAEAAVRVLRWK
jgi:hypothetical protein